MDALNVRKTIILKEGNAFKIHAQLSSDASTALIPKHAILATLIMALLSPIKMDSVNAIQINGSLRTKLNALAAAQSSNTAQLVIPKLREEPLYAMHAMKGFSRKSISALPAQKTVYNVRVKPTAPNVQILFT